MEDLPRNIYIHIPFCQSRCSYCNFSVIVNTSDDIHQEYFFALKKEILNSRYFSHGEKKEKNFFLRSVYF